MMIEENIGCTFIRINPDAADFNINKVVNQVYMKIKQSTIKSAEKSLIDNLSRELLEAAMGLKSK